MENSISVEEYCSFYKIEVDFIQQLVAHGLVEIPDTTNEVYLNNDELPKIERFIHLHYDLDINVEGIEAIHHLLERVDNLQKKLNYLHNKLISQQIEM